MGKRSEPRENARASPSRRTLARSRETRFTRPNRRACSQASFKRNQKTKFTQRFVGKTNCIVENIKDVNCLSCILYFALSRSRTCELQRAYYVVATVLSVGWGGWVFHISFPCFYHSCTTPYANSSANRSLHYRLVLIQPISSWATLELERRKLKT